MTDDGVPGSPGAAFAQPSGEREPLIEIELDRRAALLDGIETETCVMCGVARATAHTTLHVPGRFQSISLRTSLCASCRADLEEAYGKLRRVSSVVRAVYFAQLAALVVTMATGGGAFVFSGLSVLLLGTIGGSLISRRRLLRDMPRLVATGTTSVTLRAPRTWARVLADEKPKALARPPLLSAPPAPTSSAPTPSSGPASRR